MLNPDVCNRDTTISVKNSYLITLFNEIMRNNLFGRIEPAEIFPSSNVPVHGSKLKKH